MATKLTLRMDEDLIEKAKKVAEKKGVSLSRMVSGYFKSLSACRAADKIKSPVLSEISGILHKNADQKTLLKSYKKHIEEKYL